MTDFKLVSVQPKDAEWLFLLHKNTLGPYVQTLFGWDESTQRQQALERIKDHPDYRICIAGKAVGMVSFREEAACLRLLRIEILPEFQNKGIGCKVISFLMHKADRKRKPLELRVFKINPARRLYEKLGFVTMSETTTHYNMMWKRNIPKY